MVRAQAIHYDMYKKEFNELVDMRCLGVSWRLTVDR